MYKQKQAVLSPTLFVVIASEDWAAQNTVFAMKRMFMAED